VRCSNNGGTGRGGVETFQETKGTAVVQKMTIAAKRTASRFIEKYKTKLHREIEQGGALRGLNPKNLKTLVRVGLLDRTGQKKTGERVKGEL